MTHAPIAHAEQILRRNLDKLTKEQNYQNPSLEITPVTTEGANFTSFLFSVTVREENREDLKLFAKVAAVGEKLRSQTPLKVFDVERVFYTELVKDYAEIEEKHGIAEENRLKIPKMFAVDGTLYEETVIMEDLTAKGYTLHDRVKPVDFEYAAAAFTELAKLHALSLALREEKPEAFAKYCELFTFDPGFFDSSEDMMLMMQRSFKKTLEVTREEYKGKVAALVQQSSQGSMEMFGKYYTAGARPVLRHGDFRPSNVMHKIDQDGSTNLVVVDYQTLLAGNPTIDLIYFIFLSTDKQFRDQHYERLLDHYYEQLAAAVSRLGLDPEAVYSRKSFDEDMKENLPYGLMISLTTLALVTVEAAEAPEVLGDQELADFMNMKLSTVYADRVNGIFEDFVNWGLL